MTGISLVYESSGGASVQPTAFICPRRVLGWLNIVSPSLWPEENQLQAESQTMANKEYRTVLSLLFVLIDPALYVAMAIWMEGHLISFLDLLFLIFCA